MRRNSRLFQIGITLFGISILFTNAAKKRTLANVTEEARVEHAKELLGERYYPKSPVFVTEGYSQLSEFILFETERALPPKYQKKAFSIAQAIISEANKFELDPLFILAIIKQESRFNPDAIGGVGEIGLMQIRPQTGEWIAKKFGMQWKGKKTLQVPESNIAVGAQYVAYLREMFGHGRLYLSAYNMGPTKLRSNLSKKNWPRQYSSGVMKRYLKLNKELATKITLEKVSATDVVALQE